MPSWRMTIAPGTRFFGPASGCTAQADASGREGRHNQERNHSRAPGPIGFVSARRFLRGAEERRLRGHAKNRFGLLGIADKFHIGMTKRRNVARIMIADLVSGDADRGHHTRMPQGAVSDEKESGLRVIMKSRLTAHRHETRFRLKRTLLSLGPPRQECLCHKNGASSQEQREPLRLDAIQRGLRSCGLVASGRGRRGRHAFAGSCG